MLKNLKHANKVIITIYGALRFDENGVTKDVDKYQAEKLAELDGYELVKEKKAPKKEKPKKKVAPAKAEAKDVKPKHTKKQLDIMTVADIEKLAKDEYGLELTDGVKKDKVKQVLEAQKREG